MEKPESAKAGDAASKQKQKVLQVVQNFFTKVLHVIVQARSLLESKSPHSASATKINKWFNLHMASLDDEAVRLELRPWKLHLDLATFPPMIIETCLDLSQLAPHEHVVLYDDNKNIWPVLEGDLREVVVERWLIKFDMATTIRSAANTEELPLMYKQAIIILRAIYTLVRLLPSFKLRKLVSKPSSRNLVLVNHFLDGSQPVTSKTRIGLSKSIIPQHLLGESHLTQRDFSPIETSLGTLTVSVVYRNHYHFCAQDQEERLSHQFVSSDNHHAETNLNYFGSDDPFPKGSSVSSTLGNRVVIPSTLRADGKQPLRGSFEQFRERFLVLSCTSDHSERLHMSSPKQTNISKYLAQGRGAIQPFRVGSICGSSPPHQGSHLPLPSNMVERRVSITSNRSGSNASLIALLRNPRSGTSASNINAAASSGPQGHVLSLPQAISSSHGSHLPLEDALGEQVGTHKFLSSFGSRHSRRFSNTSGRAAGGQPADTNTSYMGTSLDLGSSCAPSSGLYIDDDISSFVRMIDGKSELRLTFSNNDSTSGPSSHDPSLHADALSRFHLLKSQYQQLGDSVTASLVLQNQHSSRDNQSIDSRLTGSKLVLSGASIRLLSLFLPPSSLENKNLPSMSCPSDANIDAEMGSKGNLYGHKQRSLSVSACGGSSERRLAFSPTFDKRKPVLYHDVFDDEDESPEFFARRRGKSQEIEFDAEDLLFEMTDTK